MKLYGRSAKELEPIKQPMARKNNYIIDICKISYLAFYINLKRFENTLFSLSLYELDYKLKDYK